jgi:hypothetical protein
MKRGRFSKEHIVGILKEHEAGRKIAELSREHEVSEATLYGWKSKYGGMEVGEVTCLMRVNGLPHLRPQYFLITSASAQGQEPTN